MVPMIRPAPRAVADVLLSAVPQLSDRLVEYHLRRTWSALVGPETARRARPRALSGGVLTVVVDNSPWLQELTLRSAELTARLSARFPAVRSLRFTLGRLDGEQDPEPPRGPATPRPLSNEDHHDIDAAAAAIADPALAAAARRLLMTARRYPVARGEMR